VLALSGPDDWPCWGGPARTGVSLETKWSSEGKPLWRAEIGIGWSSLVVADGRLFTLSYDRGPQQDVVHCLDAVTGKELWTHRYALLNPLPRDEDEQNMGTLTTPAVEGDFVYCSEREGLIRCLRASDGELVWDRNGRKELRLDMPTYGFAASPVVIGERVILNYGRVFALDKKTGATVWKSKKDYGDAYSTPVDLTLDGKRFLAVFAGDGLAILAEEDGRERDFLPWETRDDVNAMTPVVLGSHVFISSGYGRGCALIDLSGKKPRTLWENKVLCSLTNGAIHWEGHLYGYSELGVLKCLDLSGNERWNARPGGGSALTIAGGRLLFGSKDGELVVAEASPDGYHELTRTKVLDSPAWSFAPVLANGRIYVRDVAGHLAALDHRVE
jgi:outer membrane protein assembly factor BamB